MSPQRHRTPKRRTVIGVGLLIPVAVVAVTFVPRVAPTPPWARGGSSAAAEPTHPVNTARSTAAIADPAAPPASEGQWTLSFADEFGGTALDTGKWSTCYDWDCTNRGNNELEWYQAANVTVSGGQAHLTATRTPTNGMPYASGLIQSNGKFDFQYGYAEIGVHFPRGAGLWPAFWLIPQDHSWPPEIDAVETHGNEPNIVSENIFWDGGSSPFYARGTDFTKGFHTFGVDWEPDSVTWYIDGVAQRQVRVSISNPMYLVANLAIAGSSPPDASTVFPASMDIDFIRVYQHPAGGAAGSA